MSAAIHEIFIEESIRNHPMTAAALDAQAQAQGFRATETLITDKEKIPAGKSVLALRARRGELFHACPGTAGAVCCNYYVFDFLSGCPFNCTYCYLNAYLNESGLNLQVDIENAVEEMARRFRREPRHLFRVGTGEIADSLALPASDPLTVYLAKTFSKEPNAQLELKTKSDRVEALLPLESNGRVVVSWSLSPERLSKTEELGTASTSERLAAAKKVVAAGYPVAFHLDPLLFDHSNWEAWEEDYRRLLDEIFAAVPSKSILWFSVGGLRLMKGLREYMIENFSESRLAYAEMVPGADGKLRYPKPIRRRMFRFIDREITRRLGREAPPLYLCMEAREMWRGTLGGTPEADGKLRPLFNRAAAKPVPLSLNPR